MNRLRIACFLSALVCAAAQAQECSGGPAGGVDATGNQCSVPGQAVDSTLPAAVLTRSAPAVAVVPAVARATPARQSMARAAVPVPTAASVGGSPGRFTVSARPPAEPLRAARLESREGAVCSGGVDGGTDATGNQCNPTAVAGGVVIVAGVHGR